MRFAYADPPYIGQAKKHYKCDEIDHEALIKSLSIYDGWALSCSSPSLRQLLPMCPPEVRVMPWVKPFCAFKVNVNPAYAWEPVLVKVGPRKRTRQEPTVRDWFSHVIMLKKGLSGAKPPKMCHWLFEVMGMTPEDELDDLFPGTGIVTTSWHEWRASRTVLS
jgi:hypothetical protein